MVERTAALGRIGPARAQGPARGKQRPCKRAQPLRQNPFEPQPDMLGQPRRSPARPHRDQHGIAVDQRGRGEIALGRLVDDIDQRAPCPRPRRIACAGLRIIVGDKGQPRARVEALRQIIVDDAPGPLDQPPLGHGRLARAQHDHRMTGDAMEQGQGGEFHIRRSGQPPQASHSGTRSAARIVAGSIRSATIAHLSPSTMTSGTSGREL
jgi:hypothetical protein